MTMLMAVAVLLTGCNKNKNDEPKEKAAQEEKTESRDNGEEEMSEEDKKNAEYAELVKRTKGISGLIEGDLIVQDVSIYKAVEDGDKLSLLVSYAELGYIYKDQVFENTAGMLMPLKLIYEKNGDDYELKERMNAEDGEGYFDSLVKMADGDKELAQKVAGPGINERYDYIMKDLYKISAECIACGQCLPECPVDAISEG